ncbi:FAD-binding and (Fe-S)-binding domain-containing protein [Singulisphaera sp. PoT]|uniref:FAD-binding and (Fe-S)-binding domain-containing protein n=1 Tax=Singulisphaera sp. PoT TaxID=3411797 RepID=UPI003BF5C813
MDERRARIHEDLRGILAGDLLFEPLERASYAQDASLYEIDPLGVVVPKSEEDILSLLRYAGENQIPLHPRGGGTDVSGAVLGPGIVIDFSRYFRRIVSIGPDNVVVQPGVVIDVVNGQLAPLGRKLGPDPAGSESGTVGGMIGVDASGPRALCYGATSDHVLSLKVAFANGEITELKREAWPSFDDDPTDFKSVILRKLGALNRRNGELIARKSPRTPRHRAGYALGPASSPAGIDLARLVVGSEGTLALVLEAKLRTVPIPTALGAVLLSFARIGDAAQAVAHCLESSPTICDLHDWRSIRLVCEAVPAFREWIPDSAGAVLIVAFEGDEPEEVAARVHSFSRRISRSRLLISDPVQFTKRAESERLLSLRKLLEPLLMRTRGTVRPVSFIEDVAVPPQVLPDFLARLQTVLKLNDVNWVLDAHAGVGRIRTMPFLDLSDPSDVAKLEPLATQVYEIALACGGTISSGSASGLVRTQFLRRQFGDLVPIYREVKDAFDPLNLLNPGKVIGDDPQLMLRNLKRFAPEPEAEPELESTVIKLRPLPVLRWTERGMEETASACNGCGACRTKAPDARMCPTFRALGVEAASPRSKANLIRQLISGSVDPKLWGTEELRQNANLCIHCNLCSQDCPSGLDVSSLMLEAKAAYVENHGLSQGDWMLSRVDFWSSLASRFPIITNALLTNKSSRWVFDRVFGISKMRQLPKAHRTPFVRRAAKLGLSRPNPQKPGPRVVYFVDVYANHFDQELAEAVVAVLHQAEVNVYVPGRQSGSGMPALVAGDIDRARELALANLRILGDAVRDGYTIVCSEPTAALMLRHEYLKLTDDLDASLVAQNTRDLGEYLSGLDARGQLPQPTNPLRARVGYHQPCHLRALQVGTPGLDLIRRIPELEVEFIDRGCSGMAGTFGLRREHFRTSLRAGRGMLRRLRESDLEIGATECGACRMQMEQGSSKRTLHPIKLLSLGYGLSPSLIRHFQTPKSRNEMS